jgi:hypothetical protein
MRLLSSAEILAMNLILLYSQGEIKRGLNKGNLTAGSLILTALREVVMPVRLRATCILSK